MTDTTYNYPPSDWVRAREQCREALIETAKARDLITYGDLTRKITAIRFDPHAYSFHGMLYQISVEEDRAGRGLLSAIVIHAPDASVAANRPGVGYWSCAKDCGRNISDREKSWTEEVGKVFADWAPEM